MLTEYFSSNEFKLSQEKAEYKRAYTVCLGNDIINTVANILSLPKGLVNTNWHHSQMAQSIDTPTKNPLTLD